MPYSTTSVLNSDTGFAGEAHNRLEQSPSLATVLVALGIVYGDLGTSPLYALQTIVHIVGHEFRPEEALGSLSLVVWSLIITISVKYGVFVMRADNHGEGGILVLMAMTGADWSGRRRWLVICGRCAFIFGRFQFLQEAPLLGDHQVFHVLRKPVQSFSQSRIFDSAHLYLNERRESYDGGDGRKGDD